MNDNDLITRGEILDMIIKKAVIRNQGDQNAYVKGWNDCANYLCGAIETAEATVPITLVREVKKKRKKTIQ